MHRGVGLNDVPDHEVARSGPDQATTPWGVSSNRPNRQPASRAHAGFVLDGRAFRDRVERVNAVAESAERWVAEAELAVAAAHQRAAEVYESWLQHGRSAFSREELAQRAQAHRDKVVASRSVDRLGERTLAMFERRVLGAPERRAARGLVVLAALARLKMLLTERIDRQVDACRGKGASWAEIASALGVTRQTAHQRYQHHDERRGSG